MKTTKFTDEQIAFALKQAETGTKAGDVCRKKGISDATFSHLEEKVWELGSALNKGNIQNCES